MGNKPKEFEAYDKDEAAKKYAEYYNTHCDYRLLDEEIEIFVEGKNGIRTLYKVSAERSINYISEEIF